MKGADASILPSFVTYSLILKGQNRIPRPKSGKKEKESPLKETVFLSQNRALSADAGG